MITLYQFDSPLTRHARTLGNLATYGERMKQRYYA